MLDWLAKKLTKVKYVDKLKGRESTVGRTLYTIPFIIKIEKDYEHKESILKHEFQHVEDTLMTLWIATLLSQISKRVLLWMETRAYLQQLDIFTVDEIARILKYNYNMPYTLESIKEYIRNNI